MKLKIISLNIWSGKFFPLIWDFVKTEKPDIVLFQEFPKGMSGRSDRGTLEPLLETQEKLQMSSHFAPMWQIDNFELGLAVFTNLKDFNFESKFYFKDTIKYDTKPAPGKWEFPGLVLGLKIQPGATPITIYTTHFQWSLFPEITDDQRQAAAALTSHLDSIENLILTGDFNVTQNSEIYQTISKTLIDDRPEGTTNTLHPVLHIKKINDYHEPLAVDYVFHKGPAITKLKTTIANVPISDHLPIVAEYEIN